MTQGRTQNPTTGYTPSLVGYGHTFDFGIDRNTNELAKKTGVLERIYYPTGGYSKFSYSSNVAIGNIGIIDTKVYNINLTNPSITFLNTDANAYYTLNTELSCMTYTSSAGSQYGCTSPQNSTELGANQWYYKLSNISNGNVINSNNYTDWIGYCKGTPGQSTTCIKKSTFKGKLPIGNIKLEVLRPYTNFPEPKAQLTVFSELSQSQTILTGGLRIDKVETIDKNSITAAKEYNYQKTDGTTSGIQMRKPSFLSYGVPQALWIQEEASNTIPTSVCQSASWGVQLESSSLSPLGTSASGSHVGYSRVVVTEKQGGNTNGSSTFEYVNISDVEPSSNSLFFNTPTRSNGSNGMILKETYKNDTGQIVKEVERSEPILLKENVVKSLRYDTPGSIPCNSWYLVQIPITPTFTQSEPRNLYLMFDVYDIPIGFWYQAKESVKVY